MNRSASERASLGRALWMEKREIPSDEEKEREGEREEEKERESES